MCVYIYIYTYMYMHADWYLCCARIGKVRGRNQAENRQKYASKSQRTDI